MTAPHREIIDDLLALLVTGVAGFAGSTQYREEPVRHPPNGTHLAVWYEGDTVNDQNNTTMSLELEDLYAVRYWQPARERSRKVVDEDAASDIEELKEAAMKVILANQSSGQAYRIRYAGSRKFIGRDDGDPNGGLVAGFEMAVTGRRAVVLT